MHSEILRLILYKFITVIRVVKNRNLYTTTLSSDRALIVLDFVFQAKIFGLAAHQSDQNLGSTLKTFSDSVSAKFSYCS